MSSSDDDNDWLGILGILGGALLLGKLASNKEQEREEEIRREAEKRERREARKKRKVEKLEVKRRKTECLFNDGISESEFEQIVANSRKHMKRVQLRSVGPVVYGTVRTQSGLSTWNFRLDFNDFGHITGRHWDSIENTDSSYPETIAANIRSEILDRLPPGTTREQEETVEDLDDYCVEEQSEIEDFTNRKKKSRLLRRVCAFLATILVCIVGVYILQGFTPIGVSSYSLQGMYYEEVVEKLHSSGFERITLEELEDLNVLQRAQRGAVSEVIVGGDTVFTSNKKYHKFTSITVKYHTLKDIPPSCTSKEAKEMACTELKELFEKDGFINIQTEELPDLITGWIIKENSVAKISIAGSTKFTQEDLFDPDSEIVITYHTFGDSK